MSLLQKIVAVLALPVSLITLMTEVSFISKEKQEAISAELTLQ